MAAAAMSNFVELVGLECQSLCKVEGQGWTPRDKVLCQHSCVVRVERKKPPDRLESVKRTVAASSFTERTAHNPSSTNR